RMHIEYCMVRNTNEELRTLGLPRLRENRHRGGPVLPGVARTPSHHFRAAPREPLAARLCFRSLSYGHHYSSATAVSPQQPPTLSPAVRQQPHRNTFRYLCFLLVNHHSLRLLPIAKSQQRSAFCVKSVKVGQDCQSSSKSVPRLSGLSI